MTLTQNQAKERIAGLIKKYRALSDTDRQTATEAGVVHQFIQPMLQALGWPVDDPHRFKYELSTQAGRPDMTLRPDRGGTLFVEAKRFGIIAEPMSADIMGNTYEQYLGKTLARVNGSVRTADNLDARKKQGSYYTPQVIRPLPGR